MRTRIALPIILVAAAAVWLTVAASRSKPTSSAPDATAPVWSAELDRSADPEDGAFTLLSPAPGLFTLVSHRASHAAILRELARVTGFEVDIAPRESAQLESLRSELRLERVPFESILEKLIVGLAYSVDYAFRASRSAHVPAKVRVGDARLASATKPLELVPSAHPAQESNLPATTAGDSATADGVAMETGAELAMSKHTREAAAVLRRREQVLRDLTDPNSATRAQAARELSPVGTGVTRLTELLGDPDEEVRAVATERLGVGHSYEATHALIGLLRDPSPHVVLQAVDSLIQIGDPSVLGALRTRLGENPERNLQVALEQAVDVLVGKMEPEPELANDPAPPPEHLEQATSHRPEP